MRCEFSGQFGTGEISRVQQVVALTGAESVTTLFNNATIVVTSGDGTLSPSVDLGYVLNSVAAVQLQLSALDCANYDCGLGMCVLDDYTPTCDCDGTGYTGSNCQLPENTSDSSKGDFCCECRSPAIHTHC